MRFALCGLLVGVAVASCAVKAQEAPVDWSAYIDHIVALLEEDSVLRYEIDWAQFRARVARIEKPYNLARESERYEVLRQLFALLQDHCDVHSTLYPAAMLEANRAAWADGRLPHAPGEGLANPYGIDARLLEGRIGYISIPPAFCNAAIGVAEAPWEMGLEFLRLVRVLDAEEPVGWIVDLRHDRGGYPSTRWIGLHPFLVEGRLFGHAVPEPKAPPTMVGWTFFHEGVVDEVWAGDQSRSLVVDLGEERYRLRDAEARIAVLVGRSTASAGEYAALALRQNPRVRVFGEPTLGATTSMEGFELEDGSLLLVAAKYMADPAGHVFAASTRAAWAVGSTLATGDCVAEPLQPDEMVRMPAPLSAAAFGRMTADEIVACSRADPVLDAAVVRLRTTQTPSAMLNPAP